MKKPLIIGEAPSRTSNPAEPVGPRSSRRLVAVGGWSVPRDRTAREVLLDHFDLANLLDVFPGDTAGKGTAWETSYARSKAEAFDFGGFRPAIILLGRRVGTAFGVRRPYCDWATPGDGLGLPTAAVAVIPHPSGIVTTWNDPRISLQVRETLRRAAWTGAVVSEIEARLGVPS